MLQKRRLDSIKQEMKRVKMNILGMSEVRWQGARKITSGTFEIFYTGGTKHERRVALVLEQEMGKIVKGHKLLSNHVLLLKIAGKSLDFNIIQIFTNI